MKTEERAIIDKFLRKNNLRSNLGLVKSVDDVEKAEARGKLANKRRAEAQDLVIGYTGKTSYNLPLQSVLVLDAAKILLDGSRTWNANIADYSDKEFAQILRTMRAICEGLTVVFPPEDGEGA